MFLISLLAACAALAQSTAPPAAPVSDAELSRRLDDVVVRATLGQFWGGVLVARNGQVLLCKGYGVATDKLEPITGDTLFDIGSITKMFTAAAILKLESMGKLSTADTIDKYFSDAGPDAAEITLQHLLSHTSGKSDSKGAIQPLDFDDRDGAVQKFVQSKSAAKPGEKFEYCNGGYVVLAAIVEKVSGKPYEQAVRDLVLAPAGMKGSGFLDGAGLDPTRQSTRVCLTQGPRVGRRGLLLDKGVEPWAWGLRGAGGLVTSLNDLLAFDAAIRDGRILDQTAAAKWLTPGRGNYACGWFVQQTDDGRLRQFHSGSTRGYICEIARFPEDGTFIAVLSNEGVRTLNFGMTSELANVLWPPPELLCSATLEFVKELQVKGNAVVFEEGLVIDVAPSVGKEDVVITAAKVSEGGRKEVLRATLNRAAAQVLSRQIAHGLKSGSHQNAKNTGTELGIFGYAYREALEKGDTTIQVANGTWFVMPSYLGAGEGGKKLYDDRLVINMSDSSKPGGWQVMIKADDAAAEKFRAAIDSACGAQPRSSSTPGKAGPG